MSLEFNILTFILLMLIIFPLICLMYRIFHKDKYNEEIYYQPPNNYPPALINSLFNGGINKRLGNINIGSFYLTLLDLINRNYVSVKIVTKKHKKHNRNKLKKSQNNFDIKYEKTLDKIILKINKQPIDKLYSFEKNVLKCISALEYKGNINILNTSAIKKRLKVNTFQKNYDAWIKNFYNEFFKDNNLNLFNSRFDKILKIYGVFLLGIFIFTSVFSYLDSLHLDLILSFIIGILGICLIIIPFKSLGGWTKKGKELKTKWNLFKEYYYDNLKSSNPSQEFLNEGIGYMPYLFALGIPKTILIDSFSQSNNTTDAFLFLKYGTDSLIRNIVKDFLTADGSFDPKYYNTSENFVPGYG